MTEPKHVTLPPFDVAGLRLLTTNAAERDPDTAQIATLWKRFFDEGHFDRIPRASDHVLGVYTAYERRKSKSYSLIVGCEVTSFENLPDDVVAVRIPEQQYFAFRVKGELPGVIVDTWGEIEDFFAGHKTYKRAYTTDFELYRSENDVEIHIAVIPDAR